MVDAAALKAASVRSASSSLAVRTNVKVNDMTKEFDPVKYYNENMETDQAIKFLYEEMQSYKKGYEAATRIVRSTYAEKFPDTYFISGELGAKDDNNMPEKILVCPAYGLDFAYVYERTDKVSGPEW